MTDVGQDFLRGDIPPGTDHWKADDIWMGAGLAPWAWGLLPCLLLCIMGLISWRLDRRAADALVIGTSEEFIAYVLALSPRVAVFDCDGTLWEMNSGEKFFYLSMPDAASGRKGLVAEDTAHRLRNRYAQYQRGEVGEIAMCGEMVSMYAGLRIAPVRAAAESFVASSVLASTFPEMLGLTLQLRQQGCELWAVSSSTEWLIEPGIRSFGIPSDHVLATRLAVRDGIAGSELLSIPSDANKATVIAERIPRTVDAAFGNSIHDAAMLEIATHAFAVNPTPELEELAVQRGWKIYWPQATRKKQNRRDAG